MNIEDKILVFNSLEPGHSKEALLHEIKKHRDSNKHFPIEYFKNFAFSNRVVLVYFLPETESFKKYGSNKTIIADLTTKEKEEILMSRVRQVYKDSYGDFKAYYYNGDKRELGVFNTYDIYSVLEHTR